MSNFLLCSNTVYLLFVSVCWCGSVYMCMGLYVEVHVCESRCQKLMSAVFLNHASPWVSLRHGVSLNPELIHFGQSGWPMSSRDPSASVHTSSTGVTEELLHISILLRWWGLISSHHVCMEDIVLAEPLMTPVLFQYWLILFCMSKHTDSQTVLYHPAIIWKHCNPQWQTSSGCFKWNKTEEMFFVGSRSTYFTTPF